MLLQPDHPVNQDYAGTGMISTGSVLFDVVPLPGWSNPLRDLVTPQIVPCRDPQMAHETLARLSIPCQGWQVVDLDGAMRCRPDLERLLLAYLDDGVACGAYGTSTPLPSATGIAQALADISRRALRSEFDVAAMARIAGLTVSGFAAACRRHTGLPPQAWLRRERIRLAARLLVAQPDVPVHEVAQRCGYRSLPLFCRHLRQVTGLRARDLRRPGGTGSPMADP